MALLYINIMDLIIATGLGDWVRPRHVLDGNLFRVLNLFIGAYFVVEN